MPLTKNVRALIFENFYKTDRWELFHRLLFAFHPVLQPLDWGEGGGGGGGGEAEEIFCLGFEAIWWCRSMCCCSNVVALFKCCNLCKISSVYERIQRTGSWHSACVTQTVLLNDSMAAPLIKKFNGNPLSLLSLVCYLEKVPHTLRLTRQRESEWVSVGACVREKERARVCVCLRPRALYVWRLYSRTFFDLTMCGSANNDVWQAQTPLHIHIHKHLDWGAKGGDTQTHRHRQTDTHAI